MKIQYSVIVVLLVLVINGCATVGRPIDPASMDKIKPGETTKTQILQWFGKPDGVTRLSTGEVWFTYTYVKATTNPAAFIPIIGLFFMGTDTESQSLVVMFGPDEVVKNVSSNAMDMQTGVNASGKRELPDEAQPVLDK